MYGNGPVDNRSIADGSNPIKNTSLKATKLVLRGIAPSDSNMDSLTKCLRIGAELVNRR